MKDSGFSHLPNIHYCLSFLLWPLVGMKCRLIVFLICISQMTNAFEHFYVLYIFKIKDIHCRKLKISRKSKGKKTLMFPQSKYKYCYTLMQLFFMCVYGHALRIHICRCVCMCGCL